MRKLNEKTSTSKRPPVMANYDFLLNKKKCKAHNEPESIDRSLFTPTPSNPSKKK